MKALTWRALALCLACSATGGTAWAGAWDLQVRSGPVVVDLGAPPPPARVEVVPAPRYGYVWAPGYWAWDGYRYFWVAGRWVGERPGYLYAPGRWEPRGPHWHYVPEHWEPRGRRPPPPPEWHHGDPHWDGDRPGWHGPR